MILPDDFLNNLLVLLGVILLGAIGVLVLLVYLLGGIKALKILGISVAGIIAVGIFCGVVERFSGFISDVREEHAYKKEFPLHYYAGICNVKKVEKLLKEGRDANELAYDKTPLICSLECPLKIHKDTTERQKDSDRIVELLLEYGADPNLGVERYYSYVYPFQYSISWKRNQALKKMIEHGLVIDSIDVEKAKADGVNVKTASLEKYGLNIKPVQCAIRCYEFLETLLDNNPECTIWFDDNESQKNTLIMEVVKTKSDEKFDVEQRLSILKKLLVNAKGCGMDVINMKDKDGNAVLHFACDYDHLKWDPKDTAICSWLLENGADINSTNDRKMTPLHLASDCPHPDEIFPLLKFLVENGADITAEDKDGRIPLQIFEERAVYFTENEYYPAVIELLTPKSKPLSFNDDKIINGTSIEIAIKKREREEIKMADHLLIEDPLDEW